MSDASRVAASFVAEIDEAELAPRLAGIAIGLQRTTDEPASVVLARLKRDVRDPLAARTLESFSVMSRAAIAYLGECVAKGQRPS